MRFSFFIIVFCFKFSYSKSFSYSSVKQLSDSIITKYDTTEDLKILKIYKWITENIYYDCDKAKLNDEIYQKNLIRLSKKKKLLEYKSSSTLETINSKSGVCSDYADLFKELCDRNNIQCYVHNGYGKASKKQIGTYFRSNHAWNAVKINDSIYYYDCTWGSGFADEECNKFTHEPNFDYYRVSDSVFHYSHLTKPLRADTNFYKIQKIFYNYPKINHGFYEYKLYDFIPINGFLDVKKDSVILFKIKANEYLAIASCTLNNMKDSVVNEQETEIIFPKYEQGYYVFQYKAEIKGYYFLVILLNTKRALTYKLRVS